MVKITKALFRPTSINLPAIEETWNVTYFPTPSKQLAVHENEDFSLVVSGESEDPYKISEALNLAFGIPALIKGGGGRLGPALGGGTLAALLFMLSACGGGSGAPVNSNPSEITGQVRGLVVEVVGRDIAEIETLSVRSPDDKVWTFTAEGPVGVSPSHLREHQLFGQPVVVSYFRRGESLIAVEVGD